ncbi:MAG: SDR family oxidoreductase [Candidatus Omnitrophica bacterium]|nr:SDR family oxidoreductase [Candidatus Omnitrophota bacterium]
MKLRGKVAVVTGGAKRIGRRIALALASEGCHVAITYRSSEKEALQTVSMIRGRKVKGMAVRVDQRDKEEVEEAVGSILRSFKRVDILVNNASSFYPTPFGRVSGRSWDDLLQANLEGPWWFSQALGPLMKRRGAGKIVNIIDVSVFSPWKEYLPYSVAKGGLLTLTRGLAKVLAPEVQVNAIAPGPILLPPSVSRKEKEAAIRRTLLKRCGTPDDIAQAVLFFVQGSDFVTGVLLPVDGGRLLA